MRGINYLRHSDLFDRKPSHQYLKKLIKKFNRTHLIQVLAKINCLLSTTYSLGSEEEQKFLEEIFLKNYLHEDVLALFKEKISEKYPNYQYQEWVVFSRMASSYLMRVCILHCSDDVQENADENRDSNFLIGILFLITNEYLLRPKDERRLNSARPATIRNHLALQLAPIQEYYNPISVEAGIFRFQKLLFEIPHSLEFKAFIKRNPKRSFDVAGEFKKSEWTIVRRIPGLDYRMLQFFTYLRRKH